MNSQVVIGLAGAAFAALALALLALALYSVSRGCTCRSDSPDGWVPGMQPQQTVREQPSPRANASNRGGGHRRRVQPPSGASGGVYVYGRRAPVARHDQTVPMPRVPRGRG